MNIADIILFISGTLFGLGLGYIIQVVRKYVLLDRTIEFKVIKGGKD